MATAVSTQEALTTRRELTLEEGAGNYFAISTYFSRNIGPDEPDGILVEMLNPNGVIRPHYHPPHQYQVVVGGSGALGRHAVGPVTVHFTDPYVPYGPLSGADDGITFFTLRARSDAGIFWMPEDRAHLRGVSRKPGSRNLSANVPAPAVLPAAGEVLGPATVIAPHDDGLEAAVTHAGPGGCFRGLDPANGAGQYCLIAAGSALHGGREYGPNSLIFVKPHEPPAEFEAGADGASVVFLQYPRLGEAARR